MTTRPSPTLAILCVDDDSLILASLEEQLTRHLNHERSINLSIELASDGEEALRLFDLLQTEGVEIPLIIADHHMPGLKGNELLSTIHQRSPQTLTILLTGTHRLEEVGKAVNTANLYRYIAKPWDEADLQFTVVEALRRYTQEQELECQRQTLQVTNAALVHSVSVLQATLEATADGIVVIDGQSQITHFNQKFLELLALPEVTRQCLTKLANLNEPSILLQTLQTHLEQSESEWQHLLQPQPIPTVPPTPQLLKLKNNKIIECHLQVQQLGQSTLGYVWSLRDITERQHAEALIHYQAHHDVLTGLFNRTQFDRQLDHLLQEAKLHQEGLAILFVDLDHFKMVNDTLGHAVGDGLLQQVVQRLKTSCRAQDVIARWGGDEFTLLLPNLRDRQAASDIAQRILTNLQPNFEIEGHQIRVTASIGIAYYPHDGGTPETLLKHADTALYQVKEEGRNHYQHYTLDLSTQAHERLKLETLLYQSLEGQGFVLHYQPQVDILTGQITHLEALIRWPHPQLGLVPPSTFIPIAEQNGLVIPLGQWVLQTALQQLQTWRQMGIPPIAIAVNLSPRQLQHPQFLETLGELLESSQIPPHQIELEITESAMVQDLSLMRSLLSQLQALGLSIALDDFGTGYASLTHLKQLPINTLKVDRSFVKDLDLLAPESQDPNLPLYDRAIIEAILTLGKGLSLRVVAEGVETLALKAALEQLGCRYMQGYWFSRPLPAEAIVQYLTNRRPVRP